MRQSRRARRLRNAGDGNPNNVCSIDQINRQNRQTLNPLQNLMASPFPYDKLKLLNYLPPHMIIPPGTNVSVPPPPLPFMRLPIRPLNLQTVFLKPPPPLSSTGTRLINPYTPKAEKNAFESQEVNGIEHPPRFKIQVPPPPLPPPPPPLMPLSNFPITVRPPAPQSPFMEAQHGASGPREFSRIFAENTIKAALGLSAGPQVQLRNYQNLSAFSN